MIFKGILVALLVMFVVRRIARRVRTGSWRGGCHGRGRWHRGGGWGMRGGDFRARAGLGWLSHQLELDRQQRDLLEELAHDLARSAQDLRHGARKLMREAVVATASDSFDRAALESAAAARRDDMAGATGRSISTLERLHETLRPEQRARLGAWIERFWGAGAGADPAPAGAGGPYRV